MQRQTTAWLTLCLMGAVTFSSAQNGSSFQSPQVKLVWETKAVLKTPESVLYDETDSVLFVSNINGDPLQHDKNGFISMMSPDGEMLKLNWATGLDAPKGMGISQGKLYVADIDMLVEISIQDGKVLSKYPAAGAKFLNDVTVDEDGVVYITDMQTNRIYSFKDGKLDVWLEDESLDKPNGILAEHGRLLVGTRNNILLIRLDSKEIKVQFYDTGGIDGLVSAGRGNYLTTDWAGLTQQVNLLEGIQKLIDTTPDKINAADLEFIQSKRLMLIPTFNDNRVRAYTLEQ
ncbi:MAG: hypothetical protein H6585_09860 [Flavobacteriales bacterium]|nr:hypothetical protein [Flavobacteriales bacterium]MCB9448636.1 hypothetical protein [Flavobacteriales bacterium]